MQLKFSTEVRSSLREVKVGFNRDLFLQLKPFFLKLELDRFDGCERGNEVHLRTGVPGFLQPWISHIVEDSFTENSWSFVDVGASLPFPLRKWKHRHEVRVTASGTSKILDQIEYSSGSRLLDVMLYAPLWVVFAGRAPIYRKVFGSVN